MPTPTELIDVLSRRNTILRLLADGARERHELVDELDDAKSTVYKGVTQLVEAGLVEQTAEGLRPTLFGTVALRRYDELARTADLGEILANLPPDTIDSVVFVGAELVTPDTASIDRHLDYAQTLLETTEEVQALAPAASVTNVETVRDRVVAGELTAEFVLAEDLVSTLLQERSDDVSALVGGGVTLWRTEADVPFGCFVARGPEKTTMGVEFKNGNVATGLLLNDTTESIRWATRLVERYRAEAHPVSSTNC